MDICVPLEFRGWLLAGGGDESFAALIEMSNDKPKPGEPKNKPAAAKPAPPAAKPVTKAGPATVPPAPPAPKPSSLFRRIDWITFAVTTIIVFATYFY